MIKKLSWEFELLFDFMALCINLPTPPYLDNLELGVLAEEMVQMETPKVSHPQFCKNNFTLFEEHYVKFYAKM